jgi:hypothetical protein
MTPSITIRIDFSSESGSGEGGTVSLNGSPPTPHSSGLAASTATDQSAARLPSPLDNAVQAAGFADFVAPPPSPSLVPAGSAGSASGVSGLSSIPTPFSAGGFSPASTDASGDGAPTPFDSIQGSSAVGVQAPTPHSGDGGPAEQAASVSPRPDEGSDKKRDEGSSKKGKK